MDWDKLKKNIFSDDSSSYLDQNKSLNEYVDRDIVPHLNNINFEELDQLLNNFQPTDYTYETTITETPLGEAPVLIKQWESPEAQLWLFISSSYEYDSYGYAVVYGENGGGNNNNYLIVGNENMHPFILCNSFHFYNSHGSTIDDSYDLPIFSSNQAKELAKMKLREYLFSQTRK